MLFNHYVEENEKNAIVTACNKFDFDRAFNAYDHLGTYDHDRACDLLAMAVAGVPGTRRALARGVAINTQRGGCYFSIPAQSEARENNDRNLQVESLDHKIKISVPILKTEADAKSWISKLSGDEEDLARDFIGELNMNAWSAYKEIGQYIEGVEYVHTPSWIREKKGA